MKQILIPNIPMTFTANRKSYYRPFIFYVSSSCLCKSDVKLSHPSIYPSISEVINCSTFPRFSLNEVMEWLCWHKPLIFIKTGLANLGRPWANRFNLWVLGQPTNCQLLAGPLNLVCSLSGNFLNVCLPSYCVCIGDGRGKLKMQCISRQKDHFVTFK